MASNLTAREALKMNVIDLVAPSLPALLNKLDGYKTKDPQRPYTLHLAGAQIDDVKPGFFTRLLNALIDPNILALLFLAGIAGIGFEIFHPGVVLPGALGGVALLTALFGFSVLPISWAGLALILLGVALLVIDAHVVTHGALDGVRADRARGRDADALPQRAGAVPHVGRRSSSRSRSRSAASGRSRSTKAVQVRRSPVERRARTRSSARRASCAATGSVFVDGELWRARRADGGALRPGEHVRVEAVDGPRARRCGVGSADMTAASSPRRRRVSSSSCSS